MLILLYYCYNFSDKYVDISNIIVIILGVGVSIDPPSYPIYVPIY